MRRQVKFSTSALGMLAALAALALPASAPAQPASPWVTGYYAGYFWDWHPSSTAAVDAVDMTTMTHFVFARYSPGAGALGGSAGQLVEGAGTGHTYVEDPLIAKAHATGIKALAMLGGAGDGAGWVASTAPAVRAGFINAILNKCVAKNYDGVDVDWEENLGTTTEQNQLIAFLTELRAAAGARARYQAPNAPFIITFPGFIVNTNTDLPVPSWKVTVASLVDQYNLMSYSMTYNCCGWDTWLWAALKDSAPTHPTSIESSIQAYVDAGVPRSKMGMGLGLYSSGYSAPVTGPRQPMSTAYYWADYQATWADLYKKGMLSSGYQFDAAAQTGYYTYSPPKSYQGNSVSMLITEDLQSIAAKGAWTKAGNCGGTIVWTINYGFVDAATGNPPMQAVKQAFLGTPTTYTLTASKTGSGSGTITSSPAGISCGADCTEAYNSGTIVTLSQTPAAGSTFTGWSGACTGTGACQVTMNAAKSVTATFTLTPVSYALTVTKSGTGTGTISSSPAGISCGADCTEPYASGTVVTLSQTAAAGSTFAGWSGACTGTGACQVTMNAAKSVAATFTLNSYTLSVTKSGTGSGTVTSSPAGISCGADCSEPYGHGTSVTLSATPVSGSTFAGWGGACTGTGACTVTMDAAKAVTATFTLNSYTLSVAKAGTGSGTVTSSPAGISCGADCSEPYGHGSSVTLTAVPATGSVFSGWTGPCSGTGACTVTMTAAQSVIATFTLESVNHTLTVTKGGAGTGTVTSTPAGINCGADCSESYAAGTSVTLTATPATGSTFTGWSGPCSGTGACTLTMSAAQSVIANFGLASVSHALTVTKTGDGSGTVTSSPAGISCGADCSESYTSGTVVTLTATPASGSTFSGWKSGPCSGTGACQVTMTAAVSVTASFTAVPVQYALTVTKAGTGSGTVTSSPAGISCGTDCSGSYDSGTVVTLTPSAAADSTFAGWGGACSGTGACQVTMSAARSVAATFSLKAVSYALTVTKAGTGAGTVTSSPAGISCGADCSETYGSGTVVTLAAAATAGSTFAGWSGACTGTGSCQVTMSAARSVVATFDLLPPSYALTVTRAGDGAGTVTSSPAGISCGVDCSESYVSGTVVTLTPTPSTGSVFVGWSGACTGAAGCQVTMSAARSVTATFGLAMYSLTVTRTGSGSGSVTSSPSGIDCGADCSETFNRGTVVSLTPTPASGSSFGGWSGACVGTASCQVTMDASKAVAASFLAGGPPPPPGDFDRDGRPDLLWRHSVDGSLYVWFLVNARMTSGAYLDPRRQGDRRLILGGFGDLDRDTHTDLVWQDQRTGALSAWLMNGTKSLRSVALTGVTLPAPSSGGGGRQRRKLWQLRGVVDMNGDGHNDLLWHHPQGGDLYVSFMSGTGAVGGAALSPGRFADVAWQLRGVGDFNGDGNADLLWHHQGTGDLYVWFMNRTTASGAAYLNPSRFADVRWQVARVADLNSDGKADILWHHEATGDLYVWYMNGTTATGGGYLTPSRAAAPAWKVAPR